jgi:hypothetical protein
MLSRRATILVVMAALAPQARAMAQTSQAPKPPGQGITMEDARRIATENGVARIEEIAFDDGQWKVEGRDSLGSEIEIKLRASDGAIMKLERERPASAKAGR